MSILFFILIILIATVLQASTGFGFSIIATPFLLLLFSPGEAIQINLILSLVISVALIQQVKQDVNVPLLKRMVMGSVPGLVGGMLLFLWIDEAIFKETVGVFILLLTGLLLLRVQVKKTVMGDYVVGGLSGVLTTSIGMPGPPLLLYFAGSQMQKAQLRATTLFYYLYLYAVSLIFHLVSVGTTKTVWRGSGFALPLVLLGLVAGQKLFHRLSGKQFQGVIYLLLVVTGFILLFVD